jgi:hypothetical protein
MTTTSDSGLDHEPHAGPTEPPRPRGYIRYVTRVTHAINHEGVGHITVRGPAFIDHLDGPFTEAYALAYTHSLLHGFTSADGVTVWTK